MSQHIGLDLGNASTVIYSKGKGIVLREPTVTAVDTRGNVVAVGAKALLVHGRSPGTVTLRRPLDGGNITDFNLLAETLDRFLELAVPKAKKHVTVAVKYGFGSHNREVLTKALSDCRTGKITLVDSGVASLNGSGYSPRPEEEGEYDGTVVCDIGAGSIEASYIRRGELMRAKAVTYAGNAADAAIVAYIRRRYGLAVTPQAAKEAKHRLNLGDTLPPSHTFSGTDGSSGMPRKIEASLRELLRPCTPQTDNAADLINDLLTNLPRHGENLSSASRIILVGGGAMMNGVTDYFTNKLGREVVAARRPLDCTALGLGAIIEQKIV